MRAFHRYHLTAEGAGLRRRRNDVRAFLDAAVEVTGLRAIAPPIIVENEGRQEAAGFVIIAESHVAVHIWSKRASIDVFSCRPFKWAAALKVARDIWAGSWKASYRDDSKETQRMQG